METSTTVLPTTQTPSFFSGFWSTPENPLIKAEKELLTGIKSEFKQTIITLSEGIEINTLQFAANGPPLLLVHGYGSGVGQWIKNFDHLTKHYSVYACDLVGFGRSSRPVTQFANPEEAEHFFVRYLHEWIDALKLDYFVLCGHSLGAYIVTTYQIKYNNPNCKKLILVDPWGFPEQAAMEKTLFQHVVHSVSDKYSPFHFLRYSGPLGRSLMAHFRSDLVLKFRETPNPEMFINYIYHLNNQLPAPGEDAFQMLKIPFAWAKLPLIKRFEALDENLPVSFIIGDSTWLPESEESVLHLQQKHPERKINLYTVDNAGHHVMLDNSIQFNMYMENISRNFVQPTIPTMINNNNNNNTNNNDNSNNNNNPSIIQGFIEHDSS
jgi:pimeloyl-ACP methyl ester carboxylesterase